MTNQIVSHSDEDYGRDVGGMAEGELHKWARQLCITPNKANVDLEGWDYLLQFPFPKTEGDITLDRRASRIECLVQVKGLETPKTRKSIKLSNWDKLVRSPLPGFFLIIDFSSNDNPQAAYLIHIDEEWIIKVLKRLRKLRSEDANSLHKYSLDLTWSENERLTELSGRGLANAIRSHIGDSMEAYCQTKFEIREKAGDPISALMHVHSTFDSEAELWTEMVDFAIGIRDSLPMTKMVLEQDIRFNKSAVRTEYENCTLENTRLPAIECQLIFRNKQNSKRSKFIASLIIPNWLFPGKPIPDQHIKQRITFDIGEVILRPKAGEAKINLRFGSANETQKLSEHANLWQVVGILQDAKINGCIVEVSDADNNEIGSGYLPQEDIEELDSKLIEGALAVENAWYLAKLFNVPPDTLLPMGLILQQQETLAFLRNLCDINKPIDTITSFVSGEISLEKEVAIPFVRSVNFDDTSLLVLLGIAGYARYTDVAEGEFKQIQIEKPRKILLESHLYQKDEDLGSKEKLDDLCDRLEQKGFDVIICE